MKPLKCILKNSEFCSQKVQKNTLSSQSVVDSEKNNLPSIFGFYPQ